MTVARSDHGPEACPTAPALVSIPPETPRSLCRRPACRRPVYWVPTLRGRHRAIDCGVPDGRPPLRYPPRNGLGEPHRVLCGARLLP